VYYYYCYYHHHRHHCFSEGKVKEGSNKSNGMCYCKYFLYCKLLIFRLLSFMTRKRKEHRVKKSIQQDLKEEGKYKN